MSMVLFVGKLGEKRNGALLRAYLTWSMETLASS